MIGTIKGLCRAEGFLMALAALAADRELCGDQRDSFVMQEARLLASTINKGADYIIWAEKEIKEFREENKLLTARVEEMRIASERTERIAKWISDGGIPTGNPGEYVTAWKCSNCRRIYTTKTAYCPGCGARMDVSGDA